MKTNKLYSIVIYAIIVACFSSCMNYYKISKSPQYNSTPDSVIHNNPERYFILRNGDSAYHMNNISISEDKKSLNCILDTLPPDHRVHLALGKNGNMRYLKKKSQASVLNEAHVYVQHDSSAMAGSNYVLPIDRIKKVEVLEKDKGRTTTSYILGGVGITAAAGAAFLLVAAAIFAMSGPMF